MLNVGTILKKNYCPKFLDSNGCFVIVVKTTKEKFNYRFWDNGNPSLDHGISGEFRIGSLNNYFILI